MPPMELYMIENALAFAHHEDSFYSVSEEGMRGYAELYVLS